MSTLNVITIIAVILFARLGVRLVSRYIKMKREDREERDEKEQKK